jgi:hypothetical protein
MLKEKFAVSFDLDGVLIKRPIPAQFAAFKPWSYNKPLDLNSDYPICAIGKIPQNRPLSFIEKAELQFITKRSVIPEAAEIIDRIQADIIIGNTGRSNNSRMVNLTTEQLHRGKILNKLDYVNFKPDGMSPDESKYWALRELIGKGYTNIIHYDDNARTVKRLALLLPEVKFVIVQDRTSGILFSRKEMEKYPNVTRISNLLSLH